MEIVAMDMKLRGMYIARQLSFQGVTFKIEEVPLTHNYIKMYNKSVRLVCVPVSMVLVLEIYCYIKRGCLCAFCLSDCFLVCYTVAFSG